MNPPADAPDSTSVRPAAQRKTIQKAADAVEAIGENAGALKTFENIVDRVVGRFGIVRHQFLTFAFLGSFLLFFGFWFMGFSSEMARMVMSLVAATPVFAGLIFGFLYLPSSKRELEFDEQVKNTVADHEERS